MATAFEIPLSPTPQRFTISLVNIIYQLTVRWNRASNCWLLDVADGNGVAMASGLPIITGGDILGQFRYLGIGGGMLAQTDHDTDAVPTFSNLGDTSHLYFVPAVV